MTDPLKQRDFPNSEHDEPNRLKSRSPRDDSLRHIRGELVKLVRASVSNSLDRNGREWGGGQAAPATSRGFYRLKRNKPQPGFQREKIYL